MNRPDTSGLRMAQHSYGQGLGKGYNWCLRHPSDGALAGKRKMRLAVQAVMLEVLPGGETDVIKAAQRRLGQT